MKTQLTVKPLLLAILMSSPITFANDDLFGSSNDALFGAEGDASERNSFISNDVDNSTNLADEMLLNSQGIAWSGTYQFNTQYTKINHDLLPNSANLESEFAGNLKMDARPDTTYRALLNLDYSVTAQSSELTLREGFADFNLAEGINVRAGQQTISWGVGYFYSPADNLSVDTLDAGNPDEDRKGTLAVKLQKSAGTSNYYSYILPDTVNDDLTIAAKGEWLVSGNEIGLGIIRHANNTWNGIITASAPTKVGDFFAEYVATTGENSVDIDEDGIASDRSDQLLHQATIGINISTDIGDYASTRITAQYYYNGLGYDHSLWTTNPTQWALLNNTQQLPTLNGQHYGAMNMSLSDPFDLPLTFSALVLNDITDGSILLKPSINWQPIDHVSVTLEKTQMLGDAGSSYATLGDMGQYSVKVTLANQSF